MYGRRLRAVQGEAALLPVPSSKRREGAEGVSPMELPRFPNPVNDTSARVVAAGVVTMAVVTVAADQPWMLAPITYGFAARVLAGPAFSPLGQLATRVITPRLHVRHRYMPGPPKRFAQAMGLAMSGLASALAAGGRRRGAYRVLKVLIGAAGLEAVLGVCLGCQVFRLLMRLGLIPQSACETCNEHLVSLPRRPAAELGPGSELLAVLVRRGR